MARIKLDSGELIRSHTSVWYTEPVLFWVISHLKSRRQPKADASQTFRNLFSIAFPGRDVNQDLDLYSAILKLIDCHAVLSVITELHDKKKFFCRTGEIFFLFEKKNFHC